jgi:hypothetical protein
VHLPPNFSFIPTGNKQPHNRNQRPNLCRRRHCRPAVPAQHFASDSGQASSRRQRARCSGCFVCCIRERDEELNVSSGSTGYERHLRLHQVQFHLAFCVPKSARRASHALPQGTARDENDPRSKGRAGSARPARIQRAARPRRCEWQKRSARPRRSSWKSRGCGSQRLQWHSRCVPNSTSEVVVKTVPVSSTDASAVIRAGWAPWRCWRAGLQRCCWAQGVQRCNRCSWTRRCQWQKRSARPRRWTREQGRSGPQRSARPPWRERWRWWLR